MVNNLEQPNNSEPITQSETLPQRKIYDVILSNIANKQNPAFGLDEDFFGNEDSLYNDILRNLLSFFSGAETGIENFTEDEKGEIKNNLELAKKLDNLPAGIVSDLKNLSKDDFRKKYGLENIFGVEATLEKLTSGK